MYSREGASSRYRTYQYLDYFLSRGVKADVFHLLGEEYLQRLYAGRRIPKRYLLIRFLARVRDVLRARNYDVVVIEKELLPYAPSGLEHILRWINPNIVIDYDDAIFVKYLNRPILKRKIPAVIRLSAAVTVGNQYLRSYVRSFNPNISVIPTVIDLDRYRPKNSYEMSPDRVVIGWIGTPITSRYLFQIHEALTKLTQQFPIVLRCVGTTPDFAMEDIKIENVAWDESTEVGEVLSFDIGIMPLTDNPFSKGKCGLKLLQYMACGVPAVGSPVGINEEIICDGHNGFLPYCGAAWVERLAALVESPDLRERMGQNGRQTVIDRYSLKTVAPRLLAIYTGVANRTH